MAQWSGEDEELSPEETHQFRLAMGTLLYLSADRWDIQHSCLPGTVDGKTNKAGKSWSEACDPLPCWNQILRHATALPCDRQRTGYGSL